MQRVNRLDILFLNELQVKSLMMLNLKWELASLRKYWKCLFGDWKIKKLWPII